MAERSDDRHRQLGEFLRARRAALGPAEVGLADRSNRRRTAGLRREEVAALSDVSASWYTWLEQGRPVQPSREVLDALAGALRLSDTERRHLFTLAGRSADRASPVELADEQLAAVERFLELLTPAPAYAMTAIRDLVAWNEPMRRLLPELADWPPHRRNLLWMVWREPTVRGLLADAAGDARRLIAEFRGDEEARAHPDAAALIERLCNHVPGFAACWQDLEVAEPATRRRRFHHPWAGDLVFDTQELTLAGHPGMRVVAHLPLPGDDSAQRLAAWPTLP